MAKKPDDPRQPRPGDPLSDKPGGSDEAIDLGAHEVLSGEDVGSLSVIERAKLSDKPSSIGKSEAAALTGARPTGEGSAIDLGRQLPSRGEDVLATPGSDSGIDLSEAVPITDKPASWVGEGSAIDLGPEAVGDSGRSTGLADGPEEGSAIDLDERALIEEVPASGVALAGGSAIDLGGNEPAPKGGMRPGSDSGIDLTAEPRSGSGKVSKPDSGIELVEEEIVLQDAAPAAGGSGRDLIAEKLESGVDLLKEKKKPSSGDSRPDFAKTAGGGEHSSSVDLGSVSDMPVFTDSNQPRPESDVRLEKAAGAAAPKRQPLTSADEIDLGAVDEAPVRPAAKAAKKKTAVAAPSDADALELAGAGAPATAATLTPAADKPTDDAEAKTKKKKERTTARGTAWFGGTVLGAALGTAACIGLWTFGVEPPPDLRKAVGTKTGTGQPPGPPQAGMMQMGGPPQGGMMQMGGPPGGMPQPGMVGQRGMIGNMPLGELVRRGDLDAVTKDMYDSIDADNPVDLVARADYSWLKYLQERRGADPQAKLQADAPLVKQALDDLDKAIKAKNADALFLRGQIYQELGKPEEAKADFRAGAKLAGDDADKRARFENALRALALAESRAHLLPPEVPPHVLAMLLIGLQGGDEKKDDKKPEAPKAPPEAGYAFYEALELVGKNDFAGAVKKLAEARKRHDQRRFLRPRRPQNPDSDPREEIFLRAADHLAAYWALLAKINDPKYLQLAVKDRVPAVDRLVTSARAAMLQELTDKLAKGKDVKTVDDLAKFVAAERADAAKRDEERKTALARLDEKTKEAAGLSSKLREESTARTRAEGELKTTREQLTKSQASEKGLKATGDAAVATLKQVAEAVGTKFVDVKTSGAALVKDAKEARSLAQMKDPRGQLRKLEEDLTTARAELGRRWAPAEMLAAWVDALPADGGNALGARALKDVARIEALPGATAEQKAQAQLIRGLVLKNQEKYEEAEAALSKAKAGLADAGGNWLKRATAALDDVRNPSADAARQAGELAARGKSKEALALLDRAMKKSSGKKGPLHAQRASIAVEAALAKSKLEDGDELLAAARKDAAQAASEGLAEGHYLQGRISEALGQWDAAEKNYRAAMTAEKDVGANARYKVALARVLLRKESGEAKPVGMVRASRTDLRTAAVLLALTLQGPAKGENDAEVLADEVLALGDKAPFDARAQALAIKGLYTRAVTTYVEGLRASNLLAPSHARALLGLVANHPSLKRPESRTTADPLQADKHYAEGLNLFFARKYPEAEKALLSAVENDSTDARFYYFLGLARLAQGKREAREDLDQAAALERLGKPDRAAVAAALERVQGPMRRAINDARARPATKDGK